MGLFFARKKLRDFILNKINMKRLFVGMCLMSLVFFNSIPDFAFNTALAAAPGSVVINEIAWAGTADSSTDEWIELYNTTASDVDLTGWTINDDNGDSIYSIASGVVAGHGYFLIEDTQETTSILSNAVINISLANTGDSLLLADNLGVTIDIVNSTGGMWSAGSSTTKATMERIDPSASGDLAGNWANNTLGSAALGRLGGAINGTPGAQNSVYSGGNPPPAGTFNINLSDLTSNPVEGSNFEVAVSAENATNMVGYGFDILYNPSIIQYISAAEGAFLSQNGTVATSFNSGLENGTAGKLVIGGARLTVPTSGTSGSGELFTLTFKALAAGSTQVNFDTGSFTSGVSGDLSATFDTSSVTVNAASIDPVSNLIIAEGTSRYSLTLNWNAPASGADSYKILRKNTSGVFAEIGTSTATAFTDSASIIPHHTYEYKVLAVKGAIQSSAVSASGTETRGIKGDNTRSDRVDGRDLENLAKHYTVALGSTEFDALIDTTYDGIIDGSDLIDIGANWALKY